MQEMVHFTIPQIQNYFGTKMKITRFTLKNFTLTAAFAAASVLMIYVVGKYFFPPRGSQREYISCLEESALFTPDKEKSIDSCATQWARVEHLKIPSFYNRQELPDFDVLFDGAVFRNESPHSPKIIKQVLNAKIVYMEKTYYFEGETHEAKLPYSGPQIIHLKFVPEKSETENPPDIYQFSEMKRFPPCWQTGMYEYTELIQSGQCWEISAMAYTVD